MKRTLLLLIVLLTVGIQAAWAQNRTITGRVLDERGQGLPGAAVSVKGTQLGTVTDVDGNFTLGMPEGGTQTLFIQAIGYTSQEVPANSMVSVRLQISAKELTGTVVTAQAIKREKRELGYSASTVGNADLTAGGNVSALSALQGKVAGVNISSTTGGPGGSTRVVLRGEKSFTNNNNNALLVVDGVIINNSSRIGANELEQVDYGNRGNDVNPDDIESMTVLKGPAAAALYGSDGANGAIMITTKSGHNRNNQKKKTEITYSSSYTISEVLKIPDFQNTYGQGIDEIGLPVDPRENTSWGLPFDGQVRPWGQIINGQQQVKPYVAQPDNIKSFFNKGKTAENYVSIAGGSEKTTYFMSLNALNNTGVVPNTFYNKYSIRFNASTQLTNNFYSNLNVNYLNIHQRVESQGQAAGGVLDNLYQTPRDIPVWELKDYNNPFYSMDLTLPNGQHGYGYFNAYTQNPYWLAATFDNRIQTDHVIGAATIGFRKGRFDVFNRTGIDFVSDHITQESPKYFSAPFDTRSDLYSYQGDNHSLNGGFLSTTENNFLLNNDFIANYHQDFNENIGMDALVGFNAQMYNDNIVGGDIDPKVNGLVVAGFYNLTNNQGPINPIDGLFVRRKLGVYSSVRFNYRRALFLELTDRNDWTSSLVPGSRSYTYPSISTSWVFTEGLHGDFFRNILNYGKIRAAFASVGNDTQPYNNNPVAYAANTSTNLSNSLGTGFGNTNFPFNGVPGFTTGNSLGTPLLVNEGTTSWEGGLELSLLNNRVSVDATYYVNHSTNQIVSRPLAPSSGFTASVINFGEVTNKGVELSVRLTPVRTATGFTWEVYGTYYKNNNEVTSLPNGVSQLALGGFSGVTIAAAVGKPYGAFYAIDVQHDAAGHVIVDPGTGLPLPTTTTVYKGTFQPKFIASWGTTFRYKGFSLNVLFDTKQGGLFYSNTKALMDFTGTAPETAAGGRDPKPWPNSVYADANGNLIANAGADAVNSTQFDYYTGPAQNIGAQNLLDASYIKLREASITWQLPSKWFAHSVIGGGSIGVFGNNLLLWTASNNTYVDPESNSGGATNEQGFEFSARPSLRNYGVNLKINF